MADSSNLNDQNNQLNDALNIIAALSAGGLLGSGGFLRNRLKAESLTNKNPAKYPSGPSQEVYKKAAVERLRELDPNYHAERIEIVSPTKAKNIGFSGSQASNTEIPSTDRANNWKKSLGYHEDLDTVISINPYHDRAALAHELGHTATRNTKVGQQAHKARHAMDKGNRIKNIMLGLSIAGPATAAAIDSSSNDMAAGLALSYGLSAPKLYDEFMATKEGLGIMKRAGTPATLAQKRRLAGSFLTYLMTPTATAVAGNIIGNQLDNFN